LSSVSTNSKPSPLASPGVRAHNENVETPFDFSNGGQYRFSRIGQFDGDDAGLKILQSQGNNAPRAEDENTYRSSRKRRNQFPAR